MGRYIAISVLLCACAVRAAEPPAPNPKDPVDYVAWVNAGFMKDLTDNAAELYQQAIAALVEDEELAKLAGTPAREWTTEQREKAQAWVERNRDALEKFAAAAAKKRCYFELHSKDGSLLQVMLPELRGLRSLARVLTLRANLRLAAGDTDGAVKDVQVVLRAAQHLESQPDLISYLVSIAVRSLAYSALSELPRAPGDKVDFAAIAARLERGDTDPRAPKRQFTMERIRAWDTAQRFLKDKDGDGRIDPVELPSSDDPNAIPLRFDLQQTWDDVVRELTGQFDAMDKAAGLEYPQARAVVAELDERKSASNNPYVRIMLPNMARVMALSARATALRRGTLLMLHSHADHAKNGRWPADLKSILPASEPTLGTDPFSGQPFVYRLAKDTPLLYSVSENCKDDGGEVFRKDGKPSWGETGDYIFWPPASN